MHTFLDAALFADQPRVNLPVTDIAVYPNLNYAINYARDIGLDGLANLCERNRDLLTETGEHFDSRCFAVHATSDLDGTVIDSAIYADEIDAEAISRYHACLGVHVAQNDSIAREIGPGRVDVYRIGRVDEPVVHIVHEIRDRLPAAIL